MRKVLLLAFFSYAFSAAMPAAAFTLTDDAGAVLQFGRPAQRVISLSPHLTEMMYAIGAGERLVGVVRGSDYPAEAQALPQVGDAAGLDFERILNARPDVILAWGSGNRGIDIARLRALGLAVVVLEPRRLPDVPRHLALLGELTGLRDRAQEVARGFDLRLAALKYRYAARPRMRVLVEIWHQPLLTVNGDHIISKVLELCGAQNIFAGLPRLAGEVSLEQVLVSDPDAIVVGSEAGDAGVGNWLAFPYLKAVRAGRVFSIAADQITRQTPRILDAAETLCAGLDKARN
ncbi:MAG: cobalamin-binding protein [Betaproteobacteria bacterium]